MTPATIFACGFIAAIGVICILTAGYRYELERRRHFEAMWRAERDAAAEREADDTEREMARALVDLRADLDAWGRS